MIATNGKSLLDDMSPEMSQILYRVQVNVLQKSPTSGKPAKSVAAVAKKIRIIPTVEEEPPLDVSHHKGAYCDRKEKDVRRGLLRGKFGRISVTTSQPKPVQLVLGGEPGDSVGSVATVHLRFDPMQGEEPPRLSSLGTKLRVSTYYTNNPYHNHPSHVSYGEPGRSIYVHMVPLSTLCVASAQWTKHTGARRGSVDSVSSIGSGATYYTSSIIVPISLPKSKAFVPTFESCLISRFYGIDLDISYRTPATNLLNPSICLKIPIQLTCRPKVDPDASPSFMTTKEEIDEIFCPRSIAPPSPEYTEWADRSD